MGPLEEQAPDQTGRHTVCTAPEVGTRTGRNPCDVCPRVGHEPVWPTDGTILSDMLGPARERGGEVAELRVERKRPNIWRWIVLLLLVALLVWAIVELFGGEESTVIEDNPVGALSDPPESAASSPLHRAPPSLAALSG